MNGAGYHCDAHPLVTWSQVWEYIEPFSNNLLDVACRPEKHVVFMSVWRVIDGIFATDGARHVKPAASQIAQVMLSIG